MLGRLMCVCVCLHLGLLICLGSVVVPYTYDNMLRYLWILLYLFSRLLMYCLQTVLFCLDVYVYGPYANLYAYVSVHVYVDVVYVHIYVSAYVYMCMQLNLHMDI